MLKILAVAHGLWRGGAQESTLELFGLLKRRGLDVAVLTCESALPSFVSDIQKLGISVKKAPYRMVARFPDIVMDHGLVQSSDVVWITDIEYLVAPRVKRIDRTIPVIAHLRGATLVCPDSHALYGHREMCVEKCSMKRIIRCKQLSTNWYRESRILGNYRMRAYWLLEYVKGPADFITWPMRSMSGTAGCIDGFIAISEWVKNLTMAHSSQLEGVPIEVVPNPAVAPQQIRMVDRGDNVQRLLYASGQFHTKGPHIAIWTARYLLDKGHGEFLLTMLGVKGNAWIESLVRKLGVEKHVELLPRKSREEAQELMANSNMLLVPSIAGEAFGRVAAEANVVGTPAIVSNRGALPEVIVDRVTGLIAEPSHPTFAECVAEGLNRDWNRDLIAKITKERLDPERIAGSIISFMETFVNRRKFNRSRATPTLPSSDAGQK